jgi:RsiW-degrading membrane proteinase PrsW (M82 family)
MFFDAISINSIISVLVLIIILHLDRYEKEPILKIAELLFISIVLTAVFAFIKSNVSGYMPWNSTLDTYFVAPAEEEFLKFAILFFVIKRWQCHDESFDTIVYVSVIATAFSIFENVGYFTPYESAVQSKAIFFRDFNMPGYNFGQLLGARVLPGHLMFDIIAVSLITKYINKKEYSLYLVLSFVFAVLLHASWNILAIENQIWFVVYVFALTILAVLSIIYALSYSMFKVEQDKFNKILDRNIFLAKSMQGSQNLNIHLLIRRLTEVQRMLRRLPFLSGGDQKNFIQVFNAHFPSPVTEFELEGSGGSLSRLERIEDELEKYRNTAIDWRYYFGVFLLLILTAFFAIMISQLVLS